MSESPGQSKDAARWRGFTHEELYRMLHDGPGPAASAGPSRRWAELASALDEVGHQLQTALGAAGTGWVGRAAGAAYDRLAPMAGWAKTTSEGAAAMRVAVETQGDLIAKARADMPVPSETPATEPDPAVPPAVQVVTTQDDAEPVEAARAAGEQRAVEVMAAYEAGTKQNLAPLEPFAAPAGVRRGGGGHRGKGRGVKLGTHASFAVGGIGGGGHGGGPDHHRPQPGPPHREFGGPFTHSSGASPTALPPRPLAPPAAAASAPPAPAAPPLAAAPIAFGAGRGEDRQRERRAPAVGATAIGAPEPTPHTGSAPHASATSSAVPPAPLSPHAGAAGAPAGGAAAPVGSSDKVAMRRFGPEAIGSSQWFADGEVAPVRAVSGRRRDLGATEGVTEDVSVDGEQHQLPPPVIGG
ncbi:PPE domain-containing protein [Actinokineospora sp. NPDC004072]